MLHRQMKEKIKKEYLRRVRKVAKTKLNGVNLIQAINTWAVSFIIQKFGFINGVDNVNWPPYRDSKS